MSNHQERGERAAPSDDQGADDNTGETKPAGHKLALIGHYVMLGIAPVISIVALGVGVFAVTGNHSEEERLGKSAAKIESLTASLTTTKNELEMLKATLAREKNAREEDHKNQEERLAKIVQNITPLQVKLKITPTLEDQLRQAAGASSVLPTTAASAPVPTVAAPGNDKNLSPQVRAIKEAIEKYNKHN